MHSHSASVPKNTPAVSSRTITVCPMSTGEIAYSHAPANPIRGPNASVPTTTTSGSASTANSTDSQRPSRTYSSGCASNSASTRGSGPSQRPSCRAANATWTTAASG
ncbi:MAG: hypothetical protein U0470_01350 [Anaerolineae bacterium]